LTIPPRTSHAEGLVNPKQPEAVQAAAVRALGRLGGPETDVPDRHWRAMTPPCAWTRPMPWFTDPIVQAARRAIKSDRIQPWTLAFPAITKSRP